MARNTDFKGADNAVAQAHMQRAYPAPNVPCWHCGSPTEVTVAAGQVELRRCTVADCFANFRGPGIASFLHAEQHKCNLQEDAERLAELKLTRSATTDDGCKPCRALDAVISVYEECAARGRTFGGLR